MKKFAKRVHFSTKVEIDLALSKKAQQMQVRNSEYLPNHLLDVLTDRIQLETRCNKEGWMQNNAGLWLNLKSRIEKLRDRIWRIREKFCWFQLFSKNLLVWRTSSYARQGFSSVSASQCLCKLLPTQGLMDNQDSEIAHLNFVACVFFWGCPQSHYLTMSRWLPNREGWYEKEDVMGLVYPIRVE